MKTIYLQEPGKIEMRSVTEPNRKINEALIKVKSVGICGSDIAAFRGTNPLVSYPRIIGHEIAGEVLEVSENQQGIMVGDKVIVDPYIYCGKCYPCSIGRTNCCEDLKVLGVHIDGGMAEIFAHPTNMLHKVPNSIPWELVPMAEPLTIALHALHRTHVKAGEHVVINGAGAIGLLAALASKIYGASPILIDPVQERLNFAEKMGVAYLINPMQQDAVKTIGEITKNRMAEVVIEASGANSAIRSSLDYASFAGRIALTGWPKAEISLPTGIITKKEQDIYGSRTSAGEFQEAIEIIDGKKIDVASVVSKVVSLDEIPEAVRELSEHPERYLKINALF